MQRLKAERTGFEPADRFDPVTSLAKTRFRPLSHLSRMILAHRERLPTLQVEVKEPHLQRLVRAAARRREAALSLSPSELAFYNPQRSTRQGPSGSEEALLAGQLPRGLRQRPDTASSADRVDPSLQSARLTLLCLLVIAAAAICRSGWSGCGAGC